MRTVSIIIDWIDRGYDQAVARSNYAMGMILAVAGLAANSTDNSVIRLVFVTVAVLTFLLFGWRMVLSFRRRATADDRRKKRRG